MGAALHETRGVVPERRRKGRAKATLAMVCLSLSTSAVGCPCSGVVNSNDAIRWWLFSTFGASKVCPEVLKRGVPVKLSETGPNAIGRFFPQSCQATIDNATRTMALSVGGHGYAYLPVARRVGFSSAVQLDLRPDFRLEDDATYVWGIFDHMLAPPELRILGVENAAVSLATQTPLGNVATLIGKGLLSSELSRGFTVIRSSDGDDFTLGIVRPPDRIPRPFASSDRETLGADTTEVRPQERDYLGPFTIEGKARKMYARLRVAGAPVDVTVVDRLVGDVWLRAYEQGGPLGPPPGAPLAFGTQLIGETNTFTKLGPGQYYVVVENRTPASPLGVLGTLPLPVVGESTATVSYSVEVGDD